MDYPLMEQNNINLFSEANINKNILPYYGLEHGEVCSIKFKNSDKQRAVYRVSYCDKDYCLKKVYYNSKELLFTYSAIEWLYRSGIKVPRILPALNHSRYVEYDNMLFILTPWIDGCKCDFDQPNHVKLASETLGKFHNNSRNFIPILGSEYKTGFSDLSTSLEKHYTQITNYNVLARKYNDNFSKIYLNNYWGNLHLAKFSYELAATINRDNLSMSLCHSDYVSKNLIVYDDDLYLIDFDKCKNDYSAFDISYCLRRLLRRDSTLWDLDIAIYFLNHYEKYCKLTLDDYKYILSYLAFPQKFWKISRDYYNNIDNCNKKAFISLLSKTTPYIHSQLNFSYGFKGYIEKHFDVKL